MGRGTDAPSRWALGDGQAIPWEYAPAPGGVINLITGQRRELVPWLAGHMDVNGLDAWGVPADLRTALEQSAIESIKRVARPPRTDPDSFDWLDDHRAQRPDWIAAFLEMKTVWHPIGM